MNSNSLNDHSTHAIFETRHTWLKNLPDLLFPEFDFRSDGIGAFEGVTEFFLDLDLGTGTGFVELFDCRLVRGFNLGECQVLMFDIGLIIPKPRTCPKSRKKLEPINIFEIHTFLNIKKKLIICAVDIANILL